MPHFLNSRIACAISFKSHQRSESSAARFWESVGVMTESMFFLPRFGITNRYELFGALGNA